MDTLQIGQLRISRLNKYSIKKLGECLSHKKYPGVSRCLACKLVRPPTYLSLRIDFERKFKKN